MADRDIVLEELLRLKIHRQPISVTPVQVVPVVLG